jgi:hypothetical protein
MKSRVKSIIKESARKLESMESVIPSKDSGMVLWMRTLEDSVKDLRDIKTSMATALQYERERPNFIQESLGLLDIIAALGLAAGFVCMGFLVRSLTLGV